MNGNFVYCNPTKLYFGEDSLDFLNEELPKYGKNVVRKKTKICLQTALTLWVPYLTTKIR